MDKDVINLLEKICNANAMVNTWLLWCERAFIDQRTYAPSVYQQRDAFSHIINMFTIGLYKGFLDGDECSTDFDGFFKNSQVKEQLESAYNHVVRAFFDCADFVYIELNEIYLHNSNSYKFLRFCLDRYSEDIDDLRNSKSEPDYSTYERMEKWSVLLHIFTAAYELEDYFSQLKETHNEYLAVIKRIGLEYSQDLIKNCCPDFFERSTQISTDGNKMIGDFEEIFSKNSKLFSETPSSPKEVTDEWRDKIIAKIEEEKQYIAEYKYLHESMKTHGGVEKRKNIRSAIVKVFTQVALLIISGVIAGGFQLLNPSTAIDSTVPAGIRPSTILIFIGVFITTQVIALFIGRKSK